MKKGITVTYLWHDADVLELRIVVENEAFRGSIDVYSAPSELLETIATLAGFPNGPLDQRTVSFGAFGKNFAGGAVEFDFYCKDAAGHSAFRAIMEADYQNQTQAQTATIFVDSEPGELDRFLLELRELIRECRGTAVLVSG